MNTLGGEMRWSGAFSSRACSSCSRRPRNCITASFESTSNISEAASSDSSTRFKIVAAKSNRLPSQAETVLTTSAEEFLAKLPVEKSSNDLDYLSELLAIQQSDGPKNIGFFGTRNMGITHQKLIEVLAYAYCSTGNHIYTSGATGTNAAVIKGALRAKAPDMLTVILPQSLSKQPFDSQDLLQQVPNLIQLPENDELSLLDASRICNQKIISSVQQVVCFAFHDSRLLLETCANAKESKRIVTLFFLD